MAKSETGHLEITLGEKFNPFQGMRKLILDRENTDVIGVSRSFRLRGKCLGEVYRGAVSINSLSRLGVATSLCKSEDTLLRSTPIKESLGTITVELFPFSMKERYPMPNLICSVGLADLQFVSQSKHTTDLLWFEQFITKEEILEFRYLRSSEVSGYATCAHTLATYTDLPSLQTLNFRFEYA
ncbi:MAG: hypothetical protein Q7R43_05820 [Candidatus Daviesbacteria bacterium]|nr:hypothetical protein [Candidatus Daviesbacteria bacterium]